MNNPNPWQQDNSEQNWQSIPPTPPTPKSENPYIQGNQPVYPQTGQPTTHNFPPANTAQPYTNNPYGQNPPNYGQNFPHPNNVQPQGYNTSQPPQGQNPSTGAYGQYGQADTRTQAFTSGWKTVIPMRPLGIIDTLDAMLRVIKFNPIAYILVPFAIIGVVTTLRTFALVPFQNTQTNLLNSFQNSANFDDANLGGFFAFSVPLYFLTVLVELVLIGILTTRVTLVSVRGHKVSFMDAFNLTLPKFGKLLLRFLGLIALEMLMLTALIASIIIAIAAIASSDNNGFVILVSVLVIITITVLLFIISLKFIVAIPAMVAEDIGPIAGLKRSWKLTTGSFWHILGTYWLTGLLAQMVMILPMGINAGVSALVVAGGANFLLSSAMILSQALIFASIVPIYGAMINIIYVNMRFKRENFHQQLLYEATQA